MARFGHSVNLGARSARRGDPAKTQEQPHAKYASEPAMPGPVHGFYSAEAIANRREIAMLLRTARALVKNEWK
jgi:hypothetical protein